MKYETTFKASGDAAGEIRFINRLDLPSEVLVRHIALNVSIPASGRTHKLTLKATYKENTEMLIDALVFNSGEKVTFDLNKRFANGSWEFEILVTGFSPNEVVSGSALFDGEACMFGICIG